MAHSDTQFIDETSNKTVLILLCLLIGLIILLILLYKKLNREADGEYTVRRIVYKEGGVRDRVRGAAVAVGTRLGVQLWPQSEDDEDGEEMQEVVDEEGQVEEGDSQGSDSEGDNQEEGDDDAEAKENGGDTHDNSSLESSEAEEQRSLVDQAEEKGGAEEKVGEAKGEASGGSGLLIDLKQLSGSAIWSEEDRVEVKDSDITAL